MSRYMEPAGKAQALENWEFVKKDRELHPPQGFVGGHGWPDPEIYGWVDRLNQLSRVCTLQSCAGHKCGTPPDCCGMCTMEGMVAPEQSEHVWNGQLWLHLELRMAVWFYRHADALAAMDGIDKVRIQWQSDGQEFVDIEFRGAGHGELDKSMASILKFFEQGNRLCNLGEQAP